MLGSRADEASFERERWHEVAERWEPWSAPLPQTADEIDAERTRPRPGRGSRVEAGRGAALEVRIELPDRAAAAELEKRLEADGIDVVRRHSYVLVGAASEGDAEALRTRLAELVPRAPR